RLASRTTAPFGEASSPPVRATRMADHRSAVASLASAPKGVVVREARRAEATGAKGLIQPWTASRTQTNAIKNPNPRQAKYPPSNKIPKHPRSAQGATNQTLPIAIKISPDQAPSATQDQIKDTQCPEQRRPRAPKVQTKDTQGPGLDGAFRSVSQAEQPPLLGRQARHLSEQQGWRTTGPPLRVWRAPQKGWL